MQKIQKSDFGVSNQSSSSFNNIRVIHKVTLSLDLLSPSIPCFLEDVKSAKESECSQYKKYCCDFFLSAPFCPLCFYLVIPNHFLGLCYACLDVL